MMWPVLAALAFAAPPVPDALEVPQVSLDFGPSTSAWDLTMFLAPMERRTPVLVWTEAEEVPVQIFSLGAIPATDSRDVMRFVLEEAGVKVVLTDTELQLHQGDSPATADTCFVVLPWSDDPARRAELQQVAGEEARLERLGGALVVVAPADRLPALRKAFEAAP